MPDIVQMDYKYLQQYVNNNLLVDLTPYIEDGTIDTASCNQDVLNSGKVGDGLYALCNGINAPATVIQQTLLDENGITVKDNMTMDEFIALSTGNRRKNRLQDQPLLQPERAVLRVLPSCR